MFCFLLSVHLPPKSGLGPPEVVVVDTSLHEEEGIRDSADLDPREEVEEGEGEGEDPDGLSAIPSFTNLFESGRLCP